MDDSCASYRAIKQTIADYAARADRPHADIELLAVSKRQSEQAIRRLAACGQNSFGENYLQEAKEKILALADLPLSWHFIGPLQSNKTAEVATLFDWVHTVDREKIARRLNAARPPDRSPLNVCIQVNISGEKTKSGVLPPELPELAKCFGEFPNLNLRGLMALPEPESDFSKQRESFCALRKLSEQVFGPNIDTLSMGTSQDYQAAIVEGATIIRLGTALFGARS